MRQVAPVIAATFDKYKRQKEKETERETSGRGLAFKKRSTDSVNPL